MCVSLIRLAHQSIHSGLMNARTTCDTCATLIGAQLRRSNALGIEHYASLILGIIRRNSRNASTLFPARTRGACALKRYLYLQFFHSPPRDIPIRSIAERRVAFAIANSISNGPIFSLSLCKLLFYIITMKENYLWMIFRQYSWKKCTNH